MNKNCTQKLCLGSFFTLLIQAKKQRTSIRKTYPEPTDGLSNTEMLISLIKIYEPNYKEPKLSSMKTITSKFKNCELSRSEYLPFNDKTLQNNFDVKVKNQYMDETKELEKFIIKYLDYKNRSKWLIAALIELVASDESIEDNELFYIGENPVQKIIFMEQNDFNLSNFLLGIYHFILNKNIENKLGKKTIENWFSRNKEKGAAKRFDSNIGIALSEKINIQTIKNIQTNQINYGNNSIPSNQKINVNLDIWNNYLYVAYEKYSLVKTLLYNDNPQKFYDFYECNNIIKKIKLSQYTLHNEITNVTSSILFNNSNFIILKGSGGLGKSMMMRHLFLDSIKNIKEFKHIPFFITLKDFNKNYLDLADFIFEKTNDLDKAINKDNFNSLAKNGKALFLFDGLDEMNKDARDKFIQQIDIFSEIYKNNLFVISSRPHLSFVEYNRFSVLELCPLNKEQVLSLIDKLEFRSDEPQIKLNFKKAIETKLWNSHKEFAKNPLLLTIMLMTYENFAEIPSKMHIFYQEAFITLAQKHDASKGAYKRVFKTNLTVEDFSKYFSYFCAITYNDEKFEFSEIEIEKYCEKINEKYEIYRFSVRNFIFDLTANLCILYYESQNYHFTHRSFQEYFCALYFSKQKDKNLKKIGDFFENKNIRTYSDSTFKMLYDMIPTKIEEYIFLPYLTNLITNCNKGNGYWTFLETLYPELNYIEGESNISPEDNSNSFLYNFISQISNFFEYIIETDFPFYDELVINEYAEYDKNWHISDPQAVHDIELYSIDEIDSDYIYYYGNPEIIGWDLCFEIKDVINNPKEYSELIESLNKEDFPLKIEYMGLLNYYEELKDKYTNKITSNLFELLD